MAFIPHVKHVKIKEHVSSHRNKGNIRGYTSQLIMGRKDLTKIPNDNPMLIIKIMMIFKMLREPQFPVCPRFSLYTSKDEIDRGRLDMYLGSDISIWIVENLDVQRLFPHKSQTSLVAIRRYWKVAIEIELDLYLLHISGIKLSFK